MKPLRIALLTHSTNPRGGVVHALELGDALHDLGHTVVVHAPDVHGVGFFRATRCGTTSVAAAVAPDNLADLVEQRIAEYVAHFCAPGRVEFDIWHAQDGISGNALATLRARGVITGFIRTVHHMDRFADPRLVRLQQRSVAEADAIGCVSRLWCDQVEREFGHVPTLVGNGVDLQRFDPAPQPGDAALRGRFGLGAGPVFLAVGGIEARKNTPRILEAFLTLRPQLPTAQLLIAGGASLLDHDATRRRFETIAADAAVGIGPGEPIVVTGPLEDAAMPALYRCSDALVFPSLNEGFGLVVLEALASAVPVVVSHIAPFTEYLKGDDCVWVDPHDVVSIADGMRRALDAATAARLRRQGRAVATRHGWRDSAQRHLALYHRHLLPQPELRHA
ncbi:MAG: MSMEG_0565 family glycosyltransferase [Burkholderiales bacterium]|nr:MSMEG_0565 family glycosyltransferase [Burkholderiales bacterium]